MAPLLPERPDSLPAQHRDLFLVSKTALKSQVQSLPPSITKSDAVPDVGGRPGLGARFNCRHSVLPQTETSLPPRLVD